MPYRGRVVCERVLGKIAAIAEAAKPGMASGLFAARESGSVQVFGRRNAETIYAL